MDVLHFWNHALQTSTTKQQFLGHCKPVGLACYDLSDDIHEVFIF